MAAPVVCTDIRDEQHGIEADGFFEDAPDAAAALIRVFQDALEEHDAEDPFSAYPTQMTIDEAYEAHLCQHHLEDTPPDCREVKLTLQVDSPPCAADPAQPMKKWNHGCVHQPFATSASRPQRTDEQFEPTSCRRRKSRLFKCLPWSSATAHKHPSKETDSDEALVDSEALHRAMPELGKASKVIAAVVPPALQGLKGAFSWAQKAKHRLQDKCQDAFDIDCSLVHDDGFSYEGDYWIASA